MAKLRRIALVGHRIGISDLLKGVSGFFKKDTCEEFSKNIAVLSNSKYSFLLNSGIACFYLILEALKKLSDRKEVILPAYTALSLVVAVRKAGLKPVLCDINLKDFNADENDILRKINNNTLCVVVVHMFGIPLSSIANLREKLPQEVFMVEDCAQAFGAKVNGSPVGSFGDISFYSFNRGKNFPTFDGGAIVTNSDKFSLSIKNEVKCLKPLGILRECSKILKLAVFSFALKPNFYGIIHSLLSVFKENKPPNDFDIMQYGCFQAGVGSALLRKSNRAFKSRLDNGLKIIAGLKDVRGIILPDISSSVEPVFNRMPILFEDNFQVEKIISVLDKAGIESSRCYLWPLHHGFDLGYKKDEFPNAVYLAERLLTLPVHSLVEDKDIEVMIKVIKDISESNHASKPALEISNAGLEEGFI